MRVWTLVNLVAIRAVYLQCSLRGEISWCARNTRLCFSLFRQNNVFRTYKQHKTEVNISRQVKHSQILHCHFDFLWQWPCWCLNVHESLHLSFSFFNLLEHFIARNLKPSRVKMRKNDEKIEVEIQKTFRGCAEFN